MLSSVPSLWGLTLPIALAGSAPHAVEPSQAAPQHTEPSKITLIERIEVLEAERAEHEMVLDRYESRLRAVEGQAPEILVTSLAEPLIIEAGEQVGEIVAWGPVSVRGHVHGRAVSFGGDVRIFEGGQVSGDVVSFGGQVRVDPGAKVQGDRISYATATLEQPLAEPYRGPGLIRQFTRRVVLILSMAGAGVVFSGLFPAQIGAVSTSLRRSPLRSLGVGTLLTGLAGVLSVALAATVIGIPISMLVAVGFGVAWLLGSVALCQLVGESLPFSAKGQRWAGFLAGAVLLGLIGTLPWVGSASIVLLSIAGVGAALRSRFGTQPPE